MEPERKKTGTIVIFVSFPFFLGEQVTKDRITKCDSLCGPLNIFGGNGKKEKKKDGPHKRTVAAWLLNYSSSR
jgi:hypothetical protein